MAYKYYNYNPSEGAAIPFAALFGLTTVIHIWQAIRTRTWYLIPFIVGGVCKSPCPPNIVHSNTHSRGNRLPLQIHQCHRNPRLDNEALRRPKRAHPPRPSPLRRFNLHASRTNYPRSQRRLHLAYSPDVANEDLRDGRCSLLFTSKRRCVPNPHLEGPSTQQEAWSNICVWQEAGCKQALPTRPKQTWARR